MKNKAYVIKNAIILIIAQFLWGIIALLNSNKQINLEIFLVQLTLFGLFVFKVLLPYYKNESAIKKFLDDYSDIKKLDIYISPKTEELFDYIQKQFDNTNLLKLSKRQAHYKALQSQINPHFLYNTLESIRSEALIEGLDDVADMVEALAVFFRYTISKKEQLVTIEEELNNCTTYFKIQKYRFGDRLNLSIECSNDERKIIYKCKIPKLTLQPLLENSIIHGTELKIEPVNLTIKLELVDGLLNIIVSDNGVGMDESRLRSINDKLHNKSKAYQYNELKNDKHQGIALYNVNNRIKLIFGEDYGMHMYSMINIGTDVKIKLPIVTSNREIAEEYV